MARDVTKAANLRPNPNPIDPDVVVPAAVRRAAEAAEAAQRAAYPDQPAPIAAPKLPGNPDGITIAEPTAAPVSTPSATPAPTPAPTLQQSVPPEVTPTPAPATGNDETWEHKYNSEMGRRKKVEGDLANTVARLNSLELLVDQLQTAPPPAAPKPAAAPVKLVTEQELAEFGPEMIDVIGRRAREAVAGEMDELRNTIAELRGQVSGTSKAVTRNAKAEMLGKLDSALPNWREINMLPEFAAWLALPDPFFGANRHSALLQAFAQHDTPRVLNFFKAFTSELATAAPADTPTPTPAPPQAAPKPGLESLAAPGRARTPAANNAPAEKPYITTADVKEFYAAKRRGDYEGREEEFKAAERELFQAQAEGRVVSV